MFHLFEFYQQKLHLYHWHKLALDRYLYLDYLEQLAPVDLTGQKPDDELGFTPENALYLMKNSSNFDGFISEQVSDLGNFSKSN